MRHEYGVTVLISSPTAKKHGMAARSPLFWLFAGVLAHAALASHSRAADLTAPIGRVVAREMQKQKIPAVTAAVGENGKIIYSKAFGMADLENGVAATFETLIRTGSIAKPITATAAMTLAESGKLDIDAPVQKYCPAFPEKQWAVTTRQLLSHTSGIRHYDKNEMDSTRHFNGMSDGFSIFAADPLLFEPGTGYSYSTYAYTVAGCVIEGASGEKYFDYVREHVLAPAGMTHTFVDDVNAIVPHRARGYQKIAGEVKNAGLMDSSYKMPGGGLVTSAEDLVRFAQALMEGKIVRREALEMMWSPTMLRGGKTSNYGLGFAVLTIDGAKFVAHSGGQQGTSTDMAIIPGKRFAAAVLANMNDVDPSAIVNGILDLYHLPHPASPQN